MLWDWNELKLIGNDIQPILAGIEDDNNNNVYLEPIIIVWSDIQLSICTFIQQAFGNVLCIIKIIHANSNWEYRSKNNAK